MVRLAFHSKTTLVAVKRLSPRWLGGKHISRSISRTELVKGVNIWSFEEGRVRRMLLAPEIGRTAAKKKQ